MPDSIPIAEVFQPDAEFARRLMIEHRELLALRKYLQAERLRYGASCYWLREKAAQHAAMKRYLDAELSKLAEWRTELQRLQAQVQQQTFVVYASLPDHEREQQEYDEDEWDEDTPAAYDDDDWRIDRCDDDADDDEDDDPPADDDEDWD